MLFIYFISFAVLGIKGLLLSVSFCCKHGFVCICLSLLLQQRILLFFIFLFCSGVVIYELLSVWFNRKNIYIYIYILYIFRNKAVLGIYFAEKTEGGSVSFCLSAARILWGLLLLQQQIIYLLLLLES